VIQKFEKIEAKFPICFGNSHLIYIEVESWVVCIGRFLGRDIIGMEKLDFKAFKNKNSLKLVHGRGKVVYVRVFLSSFSGSTL
jgi:hypothetical protein